MFESSSSASEAEAPAREPTMVDIPGAPFIFFEAPAATRVFEGIFTIALAATKVVPKGKGAESVAVCVGYLKATEPALLALRRAIDDALLLGSQTHGQAN